MLLMITVMLIFTLRIFNYASFTNYNDLLSLSVTFYISLSIFGIGHVDVDVEGTVLVESMMFLYKYIHDLPS